MTAAAQLAIRWLEDHSSFEDECTPRTSQAIRTLIEEVKRTDKPLMPTHKLAEAEAFVAHINRSER